MSRLLPVSRCVCGCRADVVCGCIGDLCGVLAAPEREPPMRNLAGTGRAGWQLLGVDEEYGTPVMALDMTGGQVILKIHDLSLVCVADRMCSIEMSMHQQLSSTGFPPGCTCMRRPAVHKPSTLIERRLHSVGDADGCSGAVAATCRCPTTSGMRC